MDICVIVSVRVSSWCCVEEVVGLVSEALSGPSLCMWAGSALQSEEYISTVVLGGADK